VSARRVVSVVRTGTANLASVLAGLERLGALGHVTTDPGEVAGARRVLLPGVGAFGAATSGLDQHGLREVLAARIEAGLPTLAICLGLQLLCEASEESPGVRGLGVVPCAIGRFGGAVRVPQMGWNRVEPDPACRLLEPGWAYFANSYRLAEAPPGWGAAWTDHGGPFVSAFERGAVLACQFHPELSGAWGQALMGRWLETSERE
jgi:imidazole glycerol phosphate synthase glutamine amidotransferase subunit